MSITKKATELLSLIFGYKSFRNQQLAIIESVMKGEDNIVIMPTGGGKSLCYQIPALLYDGTAIVISPLIALMKDQVDQLKDYGIEAACLSSTQTLEEQREVIAQYQAKSIKLLYIAPERLNTYGFTSLIESRKPSLIAIDEAHCISQWGHDFRPEYLQVGLLKEQFPNTPIIALTATADELTRNDIICRLNLNNPILRISSFDRPNIRYTVMERFNGLEQITSFLSNQDGNSGIIYCSSRAKVEEMTARLNHRGYKAVAYHAGLSAAERSVAQDKFIRDDVPIIVATIAFGMGINKPNVRFVIHASTPKTIEAYYQETGRAGRDGLPAEALLLYHTSDPVWYYKLLDEKEDVLQKEIERSKLGEMVAYTHSVTCRRIVLLNYFGESNQKACGNCDICLYPLKHYDGLIDAQKVLSCVYRVGQCYGVNYVVDVLRGASRGVIKERSHDRLSVYGIGKDQSAEYWISIIRQLIHLGYLKQTIDLSATLQLTLQAKEILRGEKALSLVKPRLKLGKSSKFDKSSKSSHYDRPVNSTSNLSHEEHKLLGNLKRLRKEIAETNNVPPYIIFSDQALIEMTQVLPSTKNEMLNISGVGLIKLEKYGTQFLNEIKEFVFDAY